MWEPYIHEKVRDPTYMRGSETERENEVYMAFCAKDEVRHLGTSEGRKVHRIRRADVSN